MNEEEVVILLEEVQEKNLARAVTKTLRAAVQNLRKRQSPWTKAVLSGKLPGDDEPVGQIIWAWEPGYWPRYRGAAIVRPDGTMEITIL